MAEQTTKSARLLETDDASIGGINSPGSAGLPDADSHSAPTTYRTRIIAAITTIAQRSDTDTHTKGLLTSYVRFVSPSQVRAGPGDFPITVRQHPIHQDAAALAGQWCDVLCYHVGASILDYYKLYLDDVPPDTIPRLESRVRLLEEIAQHGHAYKRVGSDGRGWRLVSPDEAASSYAAEERHYDKKPGLIGDGLTALAPEDDE